MNYYLLAVRDNFANFNGRSTRQEYWMFVLFNLIFYLCTFAIDSFFPVYGGLPIGTLYIVAVFIPGLSASVRRLHDVNKSGWFLLIALIPLIGYILLIVLMAKAGDSEKNKYGSSSDQSSLSDSKPEQIIKKIKSNKSGLKFNVKVSSKSATYHEIIDEKEEKTTAKEMYTKMQQNFNKKHYLAPRWILVFLTFLLFANNDILGQFIYRITGYFIGGEIVLTLYIVTFIFLMYLSKKARRTQITYDLDKTTEQRLKDINEAFSRVNNAEEIFPSAGDYAIQYLDTNVETYGWKDLTDNDEIFFMPDVCLVNVKASGFIPIGYNKMYSGYTDSPDTAINPPSDSEILGQTWMHARKDGQPDQRYSDNPRVYSINKGFTVVSDSPNFDDKTKNSNFSAGLIISNPTIAKDFRSDLEKIFKTKSVIARGKKTTVESNLTQAEAITLIAHYMGGADGEFSEDEIMKLLQTNTVFLKYTKQVDNDKLSEKIKSGGATKEAAISTLKSKSKKIQLDALAIALDVLLADGEMSEGEKDLIVELGVEFGYESLEPVQKRLLEMKPKSNLTQAEAIILIAQYMGMADGEFSEAEIMTLLESNPVYLKYTKEVDNSKLSQKIKSGGATKEAAISTLKSKSKKIQLDALAIALNVLAADGEISEGEKDLMGQLLVDLDVESLEHVQKRLDEMIS